LRLEPLHLPMFGEAPIGTLRAHEAQVRIDRDRRELDEIDEAD
jgi:hypothetical protein